MSLPFLGFLLLIAIEYLGLAYTFPVLNSLKGPLILALLLFGYVVVKNKGQLYLLLKSPQFSILTIFLFWTCISVLYAYVATRALNEVKVQTGYFILFAVAFFLLKDHKTLRRFIFFLLALHFILVLRNIEELLLGERRGGLTAGYFLGNGNDFGWSLATFFPLMFYLFYEYKSFLLRCAAVLFGITALYGIILTGSRGASLAIIVSIVYVLTKLKKTTALVVLAGSVVFTLAVATPSYFERMKSITDYEEDSSAKGRIMAWKAAMQMAIDYPFGIGAGNYASVYGRFYREKFSDPSVYGANRWIKSHSIYFLALSEYGLGGLVLMLYLLYAMFRQNSESESIMNYRDGSLERHNWLPISLNASLLSFCVGGVFLGGFNYPHIYLLAAMILLTRKLAQERMQANPDVKSARFQRGTGAGKCSVEKK